MNTAKNTLLTVRKNNNEYCINRLSTGNYELTKDKRTLHTWPKEVDAYKYLISILIVS